MVFVQGEVLYDEEKEWREVEEADQVHVEGDGGRDAGPVLQVAKEAHANVQAAERNEKNISCQPLIWNSYQAIVTMDVLRTPFHPSMSLTKQSASAM